jgi:hypothetical protein
VTTYRVAEGTDVVLGSLTVLDPQPDEEHEGGIQYTSVVRAADGTLIKRGPFFDFKWSLLSNADFVLITSLFGVDAAADTADVTVYIRQENYQNWVRYNGIAQRPFPGDTVNWNLRPQDITIRVTDLVIAS